MLCVHISREDKSGDIYYFNFSTGQSIWEHPCDEFYKKLLKQERQKKAAKSAKSASKKRPNGAKKSKERKATGGTKELTNGIAGGLGSVGRKTKSLGMTGSLSGKPVCWKLCSVGFYL